MIPYIKWNFRSNTVIVDPVEDDRKATVDEEGKLAVRSLDTEAGLDNTIAAIENTIAAVNMVKGLLLDSPLKDAFGNFRVTQPTTIFDSQFQYGIADDCCFTKKETGTASLTHLPNESAVLMTIGTSAGDSLIFQSREYIRYQPGKSQKILMTGVFGEAKENLRRRWGYLDGENGIFWEQQSDQIAVVLRSKVTGSVVENRVMQADWNIDKMDGTGISGIVLDSAKGQLLIIDLEWLSLGRVRIGFVIDGLIHYVHYFNHANLSDAGYMTTANLPVRYEITNTGDTASESSMRAICVSVVSEGGFENDRFFPFSVNNGITEVAVTTRRPILSIRPKATFKDIVNRGIIILDRTEAIARTNAALIEIVYDGTLTGEELAWSSVNDASLTEYNINATGINGGRVIKSFFVGREGTGQNRTSVTASIESRLPIARDIDGQNPINISIVATSFASTSNLSSLLEWKEIY